MDNPSFDRAAQPGRADTGYPGRTARTATFELARLTVAGMPAEQVRVRNLSAGGLMAEYPAPIDAGMPVRVTLRGLGEIAGRIVWATDGRIGIAFVQPLAPERLLRSATPH